MVFHRCGFTLIRRLRSDLVAYQRGVKPVSLPRVPEGYMVLILGGGCGRTITASSCPLRPCRTEESGSFIPR